MEVNPKSTSPILQFRKRHSSVALFPWPEPPQSLLSAGGKLRFRGDYCQGRLNRSAISQETKCVCGGLT